MRIALVGAGRAGTALALRWLAAGHEVAVAEHGEQTRQRQREFLPEAPLIAPKGACEQAEVVVLGVPDGVIAQVCEEVAPYICPGASVLHLSGATGLDALAAARVLGNGVLSLHPLQTFPSVEAALAVLPGTTMAVTALDEDGYELGERLALDAGGQPFRLADEDKPLYHAAAVFASNYLVAIMAEAEGLFTLAGLADPVPSFLPLARASLDNVGRLGPADALTGPVVRGDVETVRRNLEALADGAPAAVDAYVALARIALRVASESGRIDDEARSDIEEVLSQWNG